MSLRAVFDKEKTQSIKEVMPDELLVYKVATLIDKEDPILRTVSPKYVSPVCSVEYSAGEQSNRWDLGLFTVPLVYRPKEHVSYYPGFHSFAQREVATQYLQQILHYSGQLNHYFVKSAVILTCGVLKDWITAIGIEDERAMVIVSNRIMFPAYPHTDIRNDKNCEWFFEAQSKAKSAGTNMKNGMSGVQTEEKPATYRQYKKYK
jgi:hypothetical protein